MNARLIGYALFALVCLGLLAGPVFADEYYNCQFLGLCADGKPNNYIPAVECGRRC